MADEPQESRPATAWDDHGLKPLSERPGDLHEMDEEEAVAAIGSWFFDNFEDPVHHTSYNGREGGYLYVWGPYDAREIVEELFAGDAPEHVIERAIGEIEHDSSEWVPNFRRVTQDDELEARPPHAEELHAEVQALVREAREALAQINQVVAGIGHNNPPETIEDVPLSNVDRQEISAALSVLSDQPVEPSDKGASAELAAETIRSRRRKLLDWFKDKSAGAVVSAVVTTGLSFAWNHLEQLLAKLLTSLDLWIEIIKFTS